MLVCCSITGEITLHVINYTVALWSSNDTLLPEFSLIYDSKDHSLSHGIIKGSLQDNKCYRTILYSMWAYRISSISQEKRFVGNDKPLLAWSMCRELRVFCTRCSHKERCTHLSCFSHQKYFWRILDRYCIIVPFWIVSGKNNVPHVQYHKTTFKVTSSVKLNQTFLIALWQFWNYHLLLIL